VLHTRATALRSSRKNTRGSRNLLLAMCGAAMLAALAACGSDNTTAPKTPTVAGDYTLRTVNGKAPPDTVVHTDTSTIVFLDGTLSLHSNLSYRLLFHTSETTGAGTVSDSSGSTGTYTVNGNTVVIHTTTSSDSVIATATLPTLTFTDGGQIFVFSK
jgi:hypothetical protein